MRIFTPKYVTAGSNMEVPNLFLARAQSDLGTSLCYTLDSSEKLCVWCLHLGISELLFRSLPRFMTLGKDQNKDWFEKWQLCCVLQLLFCCHRAVKLAQKCVSFTNPCIDLLAHLPSLVNTTSRYLNYSTCCNVLPCRSLATSGMQREGQMGRRPRASQPGGHPKSKITNIEMLCN